jgi:hypothetical protein
MWVIARCAWENGRCTRGCTGMDEVFVGALLGTALRLHELKRGKLQIVRCPEDLDAQLRQLGLDQLIDISADGPPIGP